MPQGSKTAVANRPLCSWYAPRCSGPSATKCRHLSEVNTNVCRQMSYRRWAPSREGAIPYTNLCLPLWRDCHTLNNSRNKIVGHLRTKPDESVSMGGLGQRASAQQMAIRYVRAVLVQSRVLPPGNLTCSTAAGSARSNRMAAHALRMQR